MGFCRVWGVICGAMLAVLQMLEVGGSVGRCVCGCCGEVVVCDSVGSCVWFWCDSFKLLWCVHVIDIIFC